MGKTKNIRGTKGKDSPNFKNCVVLYWRATFSLFNNFITCSEDDP